MEKIININLSGRILPIEESAYEKLKNYFASLRTYFNNETERDEIINDIEGRIAELLNEKVQKGAATINSDNIEDVILSMGRPEDFETELETEIQSEPENKKSETKSTIPNKKLYRNTVDKVLGGVCSGIANFINIDPTIVRVLFAIIFFSGWGLIIYAILWIVLPKQELEPFAGARIYRNPEQRILGGVAGGIASYFGMQVWLVRLIILSPVLFLIFFKTLESSFLPNMFPDLIFSSLSGTFMFAYIILWIVLPQAKNEYQKMEMRGEKVDVNKISENVRDKSKEMGNEIKSAAKSVRPIASGIFKTIGIIIKIIFLFIGGAIAFGLLMMMIALIFTGISTGHITSFLWANEMQQTLAWCTLILFFCVPASAFIVWIIRLIVNVRSRNTYLTWIFAGLWFLGWVAAALFAASIVNDIKYYEYDVASIPIIKPKDDKLIIAVSDVPARFKTDYWWLNEESNEWGVFDDTLKIGIVYFNIAASSDTAYHVEIKKSSAGNSYNNAIERAGKTQYSAGVNNNVLQLSNSFLVAKENKYRGQMVEVIIQVPIGKKIRFDKSVNQDLNPLRMVEEHIAFKIGDYGIENFEFGHFDLERNIDYIMGADGELRNLDGSEIVVKRKYKYKRDFHPRKGFRKSKIEFHQKDSQNNIEEPKENLDENIKESSRVDIPEIEIIESPVFTVIKF
ncbi:MAG: PspC domain-containing protein [Chitinophagaceae bacterium]|nr:MAG: PspC domain-containing protein [Chitinophagaceae bacterium]